ncbi:MAG: hypothetical protein O7C59_07175 [Rickettsia endosymbiont of Ixodes persulcatus]|nr:hypothetical protein [Rickettsia endosymbiont of Ixodes persulcatus]
MFWDFENHQGHAGFKILLDYTSTFLRLSETVSRFDKEAAEDFDVFPFEVMVDKYHQAFGCFVELNTADEETRRVAKEWAKGRKTVELVVVVDGERRCLKKAGEVVEVEEEESDEDGEVSSGGVCDLGTRGFGMGLMKCICLVFLGRG